MDKITSIFKENNLKCTPQRIAIYKYLLSTTSHPSAENIYNSLKKQFPTISLGTVYKTLKTLVQTNLIQELHVDEKNLRYDGNANFHGHIQCIQCGNIEDIFNIDSTPIKNQVKNITNYSNIYCKFYFFGICSKCNTKNSNEL